MKKVGIVLSSTPYHSICDRESLDLAFVLAAFEQEVILLCLGDGVLQLLKSQEPAGILSKNNSLMFAGLDLYDIEQVVVEQDALTRYSLSIEQLLIEPKVFDTEQIKQLLGKMDLVFNL